MASVVPVQRRQVLFFVGDVAVVAIALQLAYMLRFGFIQGASAGHDGHHLLSGGSFFFLSTHLLLLYLSDAYQTSRDFRLAEEQLRLWLAVVAAFVLQMALFYAVPDWWVGRGVAALSSLFFGVLLSAWRGLVTSLRPRKASRVRTIIVGAGRAGQAMAEIIRDHHDYARTYDLLGFVDDQVERSPVGPLVLGSGQRLVELCQKHRADMVVVAIRGYMATHLTQQLLECKRLGFEIHDMPTLYKALTGKVPINHLADSWIIFGPGFSAQRRIPAALQRLADVVLALIGLILTGPVVALAALVVKLESPGPAFFLQERLGKDEVPFTIIKLRTMRSDAESKTGAVWSAGAGDPRVTRVGRFLRRSRIDELPQFVNVLRGDMSMVGPRPERQHFVDLLKDKIPFYGLRHAVKPGVTGWAQVMYRYGASEEDAAEKLRYELFSIQEMSVFLYCLIVLKTVQTVLIRPGS